jgi:hypothetical protein
MWQIDIFLVYCTKKNLATLGSKPILLTELGLVTVFCRPRERSKLLLAEMKQRP